MPLELEKKSLAMHVEFDAMRQKATDEEIEKQEKTTEDALHAIQSKIDELFAAQKELKALIDEMKEDRNEQLIKWGTAIIVALFSALCGLLLKILLPLVMKLSSGH
jgi:cell division protein FtsB